MRTLLATLGVLSFVTGVLFSWLGEGGSQKGETPNLSVMRTFLTNSLLWTAAVVFVFCIGGNLCVYNMLPLFLVNEGGIERALANTLLGVSRVIPVLILFFSGMIADRIGHRRATVAFLAIMGVLTLMLGMLRGPSITPILVFLQPIAAVSVFPAAWAFLSGTFPPNLRSLAISLVGVISFFGGAGLIPQTIGYFGEVFSFSFGFCLMGIVVLATLPLLFRRSVSQNATMSVNPQ